MRCDGGRNGGGLNRRTVGCVTPLPSTGTRREDMAHRALAELRLEGRQISLAMADGKGARVGASLSNVTAMNYLTKRALQLIEAIAALLGPYL